MTAVSAAGRARSVGKARAGALAPAKWAIALIVVEIVCQIALLVPSLAIFRTIVRAATFIVSIAFILLLRQRPVGRHPATTPAIISLLVVAASFFHPMTNSLVAGLADLAFYLAILGPLFWVRGVAVDLKALRLVLLLLWAFHTLSAGIGMLQVYFPGRFDTVPSAAYTTDALEGLQITLANGDRVLRPMGLSDIPGGAGVSGFYAVLFGIAFLLDRPRFWFRIPLASSIAIGIFAIYLSQIRSLLVMLVISVATIVALLGMRGSLSRFASIALVGGAATLAGTYLALGVAGVAVSDRFSTLMATDPRHVYYANRGIFLEATMTDLLPQYPLGAGLGRTGMIAKYFADYSAPDRAPIYVEIQWTGWLIDGGVPLIIAYFSAVLGALVLALRIAMQRASAHLEDLRLWAILIAGYDVGAIALTFNCQVYNGNMGLEFWLLNAMLFGAMLTANGAAASPPQPDVGPAPVRRALPPHRRTLARLR